MKNLLFVSVCLIATLGTQAKKNDKTVLNIIYIGNSITQGALLDTPSRQAPPVQASLWLQQQPGIATLNHSNQGASGMTTVDFLPASSTLFRKVTEVADRFNGMPHAVLLFSIMLGTNDSAIKGPNGAPVSPQQYYTNIQAILDELLARYPHCKIVLHRPVWYSPNTYNSAMYLKEGLLRLEGYLPQLEALVTDYAPKHPGQVFMGDTSAFGYFRDNYLTTLVPENGNAGTFYLHPNRNGAAALGEFWGKAIYQAIAPK